MIENWNPNGNFLFTEEEFNNAKSRDRVLPLKCICCGEIFYKNRNEIKNVLNKNRQDEYKFCSKECSGKNKTLEGTTLVKCEQCGKEVRKCNCDIKKSNHNFCSQSCSCKYLNSHKISGCNRSKFELYLEKLLDNLYDFDICFNERKVLPSGLELDIYIPSLKLAFEINGITHYQPIYGEDYFKRTQYRDIQKYKDCKDLGIELIVIDISEHRFYNFEIYKNYCNKIIDIINQKSNLNKSFTDDELKEIMEVVYIVLENDRLIKKQKGFWTFDENNTLIKVPSFKEVEEIAYKVNILIDSNIDFSKKGWVNKASKIIGCYQNESRNWIQRWCPWLLENTFDVRSNCIDYKKEYKGHIDDINVAEEIAYKVNALIDSDIDFNNFGWGNKASKIIGCGRNNCKKWILNYCPWLLENSINNKLDFNKIKDYSKPYYENINGETIRIPSIQEAEEIAYKVNALIDSDIDFTKKGCGIRASKIIGCLDNQGKQWIERWCPWLLERK